MAEGRRQVSADLRYRSAGRTANACGTEQKRMTWAAWVALAALAGIVVMVRVVGGRARLQNVDFGSVSDRWVAEHRASQDDDSF